MKRLVCGLILCSSVLLYPCFALDTNNKQNDGNQVRVASAGKLESKSNKQIILKGVVLDEHSHRPIPNLGIYKDSAGHKVTVSDNKGEFKYPVPPGSTEVQILPWNPKVVGRSTYVKVDDFRNRKLCIYVERGMSVGVHVKDEDGKPIEKASLLWMCAGGATGTTDKKGSAMLTQVSRFRDGCLTVTCPGYVTWNETVYAPLYINGGIMVTLKKESSNTSAVLPTLK